MIILEITIGNIFLNLHFHKQYIVIHFKNSYQEFTVAYILTGFAIFCHQLPLLFFAYFNFLYAFYIEMITSYYLIGLLYIHNGILLSHKNEQNNAICSNVDGTRDSHTK